MSRELKSSKVVPSFPFYRQIDIEAMATDLCFLLMGMAKELMSHCGVTVHMSYIDARQTKIYRSLHKMRAYAGGKMNICASAEEHIAYIETIFGKGARISPEWMSLKGSCEARFCLQNRSPVPRVLMSCLIGRTDQQLEKRGYPEVISYEKAKGLSVDAEKDPRAAQADILWRDEFARKVKDHEVDGVGGGKRVSDRAEDHEGDY